MKTYKKTIEKPLLEIRYDDSSKSPRNDDNLGYFITVERNYRSSDGNDSVIYNIVKETAEDANNQNEHTAKIIERIERETKENGKPEKVLAIYPITRYEHTGVSYSLGNKSGFDYSKCRFYIITDKTAELMGRIKKNKKDFEKVVRQELEMYNKWINGEVYGYTLYDDKGEVVDNGGGFYEIEDIKFSLSKEWQGENLTDYLI